MSMSQESSVEIPSQLLKAARYCDANRWRLYSRERAFVKELREDLEDPYLSPARRMPSEAQERWLNDIHRRLTS